MMTAAETKIARVAYVAGVHTLYRRLGVQTAKNGGLLLPWTHAVGSWEVEAERLYPMPKVPRLVTVNGSLYRYVNGKVEFKQGGEWLPSTSFPVEWITALADLMKNPEVDSA